MSDTKEHKAPVNTLTLVRPALTKDTERILSRSRNALLGRGARGQGISSGPP